MAVRLGSEAGRRRPGGLALGLAAAVTFGAGTPFAKRLLDDVGPELLAGLLYLGAFVALSAFRPFRKNTGETPLGRTDLPRLAGVVVSGGVLAPVLLLSGLQRVSGASGSLLLNLEGPFTLVVALAVFREHLGRRSLAGAVAIFGGAALLTAGGSAGSDTIVGVLLVASAPLLWAVDNNLTQSLTDRDPFAIVLVKSGVAAAVNIGISLAVGTGRVPPVGVLSAALLLGAVSYGVSVVLDAYALRELGAARESAIFATAPFIGVALAVPVLDHRLTAGEIVAGLVMAGGVALLVRDRHDHEHTHAPLVHEHRHVHDEHHRHEHDHAEDATEPHSHLHRHDPLTHAHAHASDAHHRHEH